MKNNLLLLAILFATTLFAQNGNTINDAISINGTLTSIDILNYDSATDSGLALSCSSSEDVFYKHTVSSGDNKLTIGMVSGGLTLLSTGIDYQILMAPSGDLGQLQEVACSSYNIVLLVGGSFEVIMDNVNENDVYYLRVFKNSGIGVDLSALLGGTSITMFSEFDDTLSTENQEIENTKIITKDNTLTVLGNKSFTSSKIYALTGQEVLKEDNTEVIETVDISQLNTGIYVLVLENNDTSVTHKFIKN